MEQALHILKDKDDEYNKLKAGIYNLNIRHQQAKKEVAELRRQLSDERMKCREKELQIDELERHITALSIETNEFTYNDMRGFRL